MTPTLYCNIVADGIIETRRIYPQIVLGVVMKKFPLLIFLALFILPSSPVMADCIDCWVNPKTGKLEPFGSNPQPRTRGGQSVAITVYGTTRCPLTMRLIGELKAQKIAYQFHDLDRQDYLEEYYQLVRRNNLTADTRIPKVYFKGRFLTRPSVEEIKALR